MPKEPEKNSSALETGYASSPIAKPSIPVVAELPLPTDHPQTVMFNGKETYVPQRWDAPLAPLDYSNVPPEHDGRPFQTKPEGWQPPHRQPLPNVKGVTQADFESAIRQQLLPHEKLWRKYSTHFGYRNFIKDKTETERVLIDEAFKLDLNGSTPSLDDCIPRNSLLDAVDRYFWEYTDMPRELPFFYVMHYVLASLMQRGVVIHKGNQVILPDMWTIIVARSGSGKTLSQKQLNEAMGGSVRLFPDAKSSLQFLTNLKEHRLGLFIRDEFAQFLKDVSKQSAMQDVRDQLLRTYDNGTIKHSTTKTKIEVIDSAIGILGYTPTKTLTKYLTQEMLQDGFAQRFLFCVAEQDDRPIVGDYVFDNLASTVAPHWKKIVDTPVHPIYKISDEARGVFNHVVAQIVAKAREDDIDDSFSRRLAFSTYKFALAYHIINGKKDDVIDPEDLAQGAQLVALHLANLRKILSLYEMVDKPISKTPHPSTVKSGEVDAHAVAKAIELPATLSTTDKLNLVVAYLQKQKAANASPITLSKLQGNIRALRGKGQGKAVRELAKQAVEQDSSLGAFVVIP